MELAKYISKVFAGRRRWFALAVIVVAGIGLLGPMLSQRLRGDSFTKSVNDRAYLFRLTAKYMHGDEAVDFDIVVGCGVRVTVYGDESSSYDAFRDPLFFVKATKDGGAVLQIVPNACDARTTDNGEVPNDFLPGAIWFDKKDDFTFGIAYIAEDAFENPNSKLKFLGAAIHPATKAEWEAFRPINAQNLLSPKWFSYIPTLPPVEEVKAHLWDKKKIFEWWPAFSCKGVIRHHLSEPQAREALRRYWPASRPRFWYPRGAELFEAIRSQLNGMNHGKGPLIDGHYYREYFRDYEVHGFATRAGGGTFPKTDQYAPKVYPVRADDGLPWLTPEVAQAPIIYRDIDLMNGANAGYAYCYYQLRVGPITEAHLPDYFNRHFATRVDMETVYLDRRPGFMGPDLPTPFFENDEYLYEVFGFNLS